MNEEKLLAQVLEIGSLMLKSGAEVSRVEDTVGRILKAHNIERSDVFSITSCIIVTIGTKDGRNLTQVKRIMSYETDLERLDECNRLSRDICDYHFTPEEIEVRIQALYGTRKFSEPVMLFAYAMISASFSVFFGGGVLDAVAAGVIGIIIRMVLKFGNRMKMNRIVMNILCSAIGGFSAYLLVSMGVGRSIDKIIIGNIMLLVPGLSMTNGIRDMLSGDTMSGMLRLMEAVVIAIALAVGFALVLIPLGV